jgi:hypothetical protein
VLEDNIRKESVPYSQLAEARRVWRPQVVEALSRADDANLASLVGQFEKAYPGSSRSSSLRDAVHDWASSGEVRRLAACLTDAHIARRLAQLLPLQMSLDRLLGPESQQQQSAGLHEGPTAAGACGLVPAAFSRRSGRFVYGGVSLNAQLQLARVQPPPTSQYHNSSVALNAQRSQGIPNSAAQRMDNLAEFNRAAAAATNLNAQRVFNQQSYYMHGLFTGCRPSYRDGVHVPGSNTMPQRDVRNFTGGNVDE